ncbi:MAG: L-threonylcarbamoyladenylate synthase [Actinomycetes bacterium]
MSTRILSPDEIDVAAALLADGGLVAFPTETVYGLGADATDAEAVARVFAAKGRPADNPLIVHLAAARDLRGVVAEVTALAEDLATRFWPGPLTLVLDADPSLPRATTGGLGTVAVRVPDHPVARALLQAAGVPVAAPSANTSGRPSPTTAAHVAADLGDALDAILDGGPCPLGVESTVVDARGTVPVVLREGGISREDLGLPARDEQGTERDLTASPGTRYRHYAPRCRVVVADVGTGPEVAGAEAETGDVRVGLVAPGRAPLGVTALARPQDGPALAACLYATLRAAEDEGLDVVVVEAVAEVGIGRAVMDRLRRAAGEAGPASGTGADGTA